MTRPKATTILFIALYVMALGLLGVGGWLLHPAVGLIVCGALLWVDLLLASKPKRKA